MVDEKRIREIEVYISGAEHSAVVLVSTSIVPIGRFLGFVAGDAK